MQRLVIPVHESVALAWKQTTPDQRAKIIQFFCWLVEKEGVGELSPAMFSKHLNVFSDKAIENGLTPEILDDILHEG